MSLELIIKIVVGTIIGTLLIVTNVLSYQKGYEDCLDDFDRWITDLTEGRK